MLDYRNPFSERWGAVGGTAAAFLVIGVAACSSSSSNTTPDASSNDAAATSGDDSAASSGSTSSGSSSGSSASGSTSGASSGAASGSASGSSSGSSSGSPTDSGLDAAYASCASPGKATAGAYNNHCATQNPDDGGVLKQSTNLASCMPDAGSTDNGDAAPQCAYGDTMYGRVGVGVDGGAVAGAIEGDDDDCKYHVSWSSTPICEGSGGVEFTVTAVKQTDGTPVTGGMYMMEAFTTTPADAGTTPGCDDSSLHPSPTTDADMKETAAGTGIYKVNMQFDAPGQWTIRFHFHEECADILDDSPHGHAAFYVTVP